MIDVINLQRKIKLDTKQFREFVGSLSSAVDEAYGKHFSIAFISDARMRKLNSTFRGKDSTTDVLSFQHEADEFESNSGGVSHSNDGTPEGVNLTFLGDIVISAEQAARQAIENKLSLENEIKQLILHGVLHLCGYDHETDNGEMISRELELRETLKI
jgi:probable rRNA maturation factor